MSDESVRAALRSDASLVVVEAPAGCGKTFQGAAYARELADTLPIGRSLVLTHTHAACSVFSDGTLGISRSLEIRTIDSVIGSMASAYHKGLGLPADVPAWIRTRKHGYAEVAAKVATLIQRHAMIAAALARRYPVIICDEHQDSSPDQHAVVMALNGQGARVRIFADPMQEIFSDKPVGSVSAPWDWEELTRTAHEFEQLDVPHRWRKGCAELGAWTLAARRALKAGGKVNLRNRPDSVSVLYAENVAQKKLEFRLSSDDRKGVDRFEREHDSLLVLTRHNDTAHALRSAFNRMIPLWEGHTRTALETLVKTVDSAGGSPAKLAAAVTVFLNGVGIGFTPSGFGQRFERQPREGCTRPCTKKPATLQALARFLVDEPNHRGVAKVLQQLSDLRDRDPAFRGIVIDCHKEYWEAVRLGEFETTDRGLAEITHRRTYSQPKPPPRAISTIHKAKGLECDAVLLIPCDDKTFPDKPDARCLLYVALSRAMKRLLLVVSREHPSPLLEF